MFKLGSDPEFFLREKATGKYVGAPGFVPGTKKEPHPLPNGGSVQVDGLAIEFNTPPAETRNQFADHVNSCLNDIRKMVDSKYEFVFLPYVVFDKIHYDAMPDSSKELGCDPDYNANTGHLNPIPKADGTFRTASGHLHIGWGKDMDGPQHFDDCRLVIRNVNSWFHNSWFYLPWSGSKLFADLENKRRNLYGKQYAFRPKSYGVEYRTPSNAWLTTSDDMKKFLFDNVEYIFKSMLDGKTSTYPSHLTYPLHYYMINRTM